MTNDKVQKLILTIQTVQTKDNYDIDGIFGTIIMKPKGKKDEGERISFRTYLGEVPAVEKYVNQLIAEALILDKQTKAKKAKALKVK